MSSGRFPLPSEGVKGGKDSKTATATCFCGAVQCLFVRQTPHHQKLIPNQTNPPTHQPTTSPGLVDTFVCNCSDCRKITASMFASNFIVQEAETVHVRGRDKLTKFSQSKTIESGNTMENHFCSVCGTLMYRVSSGFPGSLIPRIGTIDDFDLQETVFAPKHEIYAENRVCWLKGVEGAEAHKGMGPYAG